MKKCISYAISIMNMQKGTVYIACHNYMGGGRWGLLWKKKCVSYAIKYDEHAKGDSLLHVIIIWGEWGASYGRKNVPPMR